MHMDYNPTGSFQSSRSGVTRERLVPGPSRGFPATRCVANRRGLTVNNGPAVTSRQRVSLAAPQNAACRLGLIQVNPCGNFSDTSSCKSRRSKGSIGHAFTVCIRTENQNQMSFYPFVLHEISVLVELILGHLRSVAPARRNSIKPPSRIG